MEEFIAETVQGLPTLGLFGVIVATLFVLGKGADLLVEEAVALSLRFGISKTLIGATVVSLGTTLPEVSVSVMSALDGFPELALGNAVGSIICDTGLILGLAILIGKVPVDRRIANRQGYVQIGAAMMMALLCLPWSHLGNTFTLGGRLPQIVGFLFLGLLGLYLYMSYRWAKDTDSEIEEISDTEQNIYLIAFNIVLGLVMVIGSSEVLIPAVEETAHRFHIPESIIAATLVAFGTSLPELVTVVTAVKKGHGELALGNIVGADILNVLFVAGAAASVTPGGLEASPHFFKILFPAMIILLLCFRVGIVATKVNMPKWSGSLLLGGYVLYLVLSQVGI